MPKRILKALVGGLKKPWKPRLSLPSYDEPTPETSRQLSREEEAEMALTRTTFTPGAALLLITLFLLTIASIPLLDTIATLRAGRPLPFTGIFRTLPSWHEVGAARTIHHLWNLLPHAAELKSAETTLERDALVSQWLLPSVQGVLVGRLRAGNEQVYLGRDGWLFYRPDVDSLTAPGFLRPSRLKHRAHAAAVQPDPIRAIVQFRDQLAARGIDLLILPVPTKASLEGENLSANVPRDRPLQNASFDEFKTRLATAGVRVFDPTPLLWQRKLALPGPLYLATDTHWRPETTEFVAAQLAAAVRTGESAAGKGVVTELAPTEVTARGDIARMLKLPSPERAYPPETVTLHPITAGNGLWRPSREADVLLLGDSFANIFSLAALGWGESAGFAEHLSAALGGRPLDCILRNSDGAFATREILANELARGRDRLAGKKLVVWEFAARELAFGDWKLLDLKLGQPSPAHFYTVPPGQTIEVTGTIQSLSTVPRPGTVPYADHIMSMQLTELRPVNPLPSANPDLQAIVYLESMRDNEWTPAARLRVGDRVTLRLRAWSDVAAQREQTNRSEQDDPDLQLEEPVWGELLP